MNGRSTPSSASRSETLVWVSPPALTIATSKSRWCSRSMSAPSWFDWKKSTSRPSSAARAADPGVDLVERLVAVDLGLARAEQVEVRALEDEDAGHRGTPVGAARSEAAARSTMAGIDVVADDRRRRRSGAPSAAGRRACFLSVARCPRTRSSG